MKFEVTMETKFPKWRIAIEDSSNPYLSVVVKNTKEKSNGFKYFSIEEGCSKLKGIIVSIKKNTPLKIKKYLKNNGIIYFEECSLKIDDILEEIPNKKIIKEGDIFTDIASEIIKAVEENQTMILYEETLEDIKDFENFKNKLSDSLKSLYDDIDFFNNTKIPTKWEDRNIEKYKIIINDLWNAKDESVKILQKVKLGLEDKNSNKAISAKRIIEIWTKNPGIYNKLLEVNKAIDLYNKRFPKNKVEHVDKLTNSKIKPSIKTKYFNY